MHLLQQQEYKGEAEKEALHFILEGLGDVPPSEERLSQAWEQPGCGYMCVFLFQMMCDGAIIFPKLRKCCLVSQSTSLTHSHINPLQTDVYNLFLRSLSLYNNKTALENENKAFRNETDTSWFAKSSAGIHLNTPNNSIYRMWYALDACGEKPASWQLHTNRAQLDTDSEVSMCTNLNHCCYCKK